MLTSEKMKKELAQHVESIRAYLEMQAAERLRVDNEDEEEILACMGEIIPRDIIAEKDAEIQRLTDEKEEAINAYLGLINKIEEDKEREKKAEIIQILEPGPPASTD